MGIFATPLLSGALVARPVERDWIQRVQKPRCKGSSYARQGKLAPLQAAAFPIPGPLFLSSTYDREKNPLGNVLNNTFIRFPFRDTAGTKRTPPLVRVRLSVEYRVHSRQMLCVGGSAIPFGWSFLSIAKVPMSWQPTDVWEVDVELPAGTRVEYKYVILEEQDWTVQVDEAAEGRVEYTYRQTPDSSPPDLQRITRQMAIVAWQSGPNRILQVPTEVELERLQPGDRIERLPAIEGTPGSQRAYGVQALGKDRVVTFPPPVDPEAAPIQPEELIGVWEVLSLDENGLPFLERRDVWGPGEATSR